MSDIELSNTLREQLARETARANAHMTVNVELHEKLTELSAENLRWQAHSNELEQRLTTALARIIQLEQHLHGIIQ